MSSPKKRPYIGAKGIGKLALLSCAERIHIISKKADTDYVGGVIDNTGLTKAIKRDLLPDKYFLEKINLKTFSEFVSEHNNGTVIYFEKTKESMRNTIPHLRKLIALFFRFSLIDENFNIFLNDDPITLDDLKDLSGATEFLWVINEFADPYLEKLFELKNKPVEIENSMKIGGFIATVDKPKFLKISGTEEKVGIDLFVNGRLRERDILKHMPDFSTRYIASYLYGQIHFDEMDKDGNDRFGTSREGVIPGDEKYKRLIETLKSKILNRISDEWDKFRLDRGEDGDDENPRKTLKERRARSLYNLSSKDYSDVDNKNMNRWIKEMQTDAEFNIPAYVSCFLSENLLRRRIEDNESVPTICNNSDQGGKTCMDRYDPKNGNFSLCEYCKGERGKQSLQQQKIDAGTSIRIRSSEENILMYLDYLDLAKIINNKILKEEDKPYKPLRNSVMHTSRLTDEAKTKLTSVFDNVVATVKELVGKDSDG